VKTEGGLPDPYLVDGHWGWDYPGQQQSRDGGGWVWGGNSNICFLVATGGDQRDLIRERIIQIILSGGERETSENRRGWCQIPILLVAIGDGTTLANSNQGEGGRLEFKYFFWWRLGGSARFNSKRKFR